MGAITLYPFILTTFKQGQTPKWIINHELIHVGQIRHVGVVRFYLSYLCYYFAGLIRFGNHRQAYHQIPWEIEAFGQFNSQTRFEKQDAI